jgi:4-diphosphocytidyl-2-C-methyl-D-erythritol kinase
VCPSFHLDAPAKLNLGLRILGLRKDGYHEIESLFVPLDLADGVALHVESASASSVSLELAGEEVGAPPGETNLALRAARAFLERGDVSARVEIGLTKHTPAAAGLGGGSSDAAAVLRGLRRAFPDALDDAGLETLALSLGADVPYFLDPRPAWVSGVGERREPVHDLPPLALLLTNPGHSLATAEVFGAYDALGDASSARSGPPNDLAAIAADDRALAALLHNDLEAAALRLCPPIGRLRTRLIDTGPRAVGMSGSGATLFGVFADPGAAEVAGRRLEESGPVWSRVAAIRESG